MKNITSEKRFISKFSLRTGLVLIALIIINFILIWLNTSQSDYELLSFLSFVWGLTAIEGILIFIVLNSSLKTRIKLCGSIMAVILVELFAWLSINYLVNSQGFKISYIPLLLGGIVIFVILELFALFVTSWKFNRIKKKYLVLILVLLAIWWILFI